MFIHTLICISYIPIKYPDSSDLNGISGNKFDKKTRHNYANIYLVSDRTWIILSSRLRNKFAFMINVNVHRSIAKTHTKIKYNTSTCKICVCMYIFIWNRFVNVSNKYQSNDLSIEIFGSKLKFSGGSSWVNYTFA